MEYPSQIASFVFAIRIPSLLTSAQYLFDSDT